MQTAEEIYKTRHWQGDSLLDVATNTDSAMGEKFARAMLKNECQAHTAQRLYELRERVEEKLRSYNWTEEEIYEITKLFYEE